MSPPNSRRCYICNINGHKAKDCWFRGDGRTDQHGGCYICGADDHDKYHHSLPYTNIHKCFRCGLEGHHVNSCSSPDMRPSSSRLASDRQLGARASKLRIVTAAGEEDAPPGSGDPADDGGRPPMIKASPCSPSTSPLPVSFQNITPPMPKKGIREILDHARAVEDNDKPTAVPPVFAAKDTEWSRNMTGEPRWRMGRLVQAVSCGQDMLELLKDVEENSPPIPPGNWNFIPMLIEEELRKLSRKKPASPAAAEQPKSTTNLREGYFDSYDPITGNYGGYYAPYKPTFHRATIKPSKPAADDSPPAYLEGLGRVPPQHALSMQVNGAQPGTLSERYLTVEKHGGTITPEKMADILLWYPYPVARTIEDPDFFTIVFCQEECAWRAQDMFGAMSPSSASEVLLVEKIFAV